MCRISCLGDAISRALRDFELKPTVISEVKLHRRDTYLSHMMQHQFAM